MLLFLLITLTWYEIVSKRRLRNRWNFFFSLISLMLSFLHIRPSSIIFIQCTNVLARWKLGRNLNWSGIEIMTPYWLSSIQHDDDNKWKYFPRYWPFVRGIHRSPVNSAYKGQWCGAFMFSVIRAWTDVWVNNGDAGDLRRNCTHYGVTVCVRSIWTRNRYQLQ